MSGYPIRIPESSQICMIQHNFACKITFNDNDDNDNNKNADIMSYLMWIGRFLPLLNELVN